MSLLSEEVPGDPERDTRWTSSVRTESKKRFGSAWT